MQHDGSSSDWVEGRLGLSIHGGPDTGCFANLTGYLEGYRDNKVVLPVCLPNDRKAGCEQELATCEDSMTVDAARVSLFTASVP